MIKVNKLKISGFKSFAFPSEIEIHDGVTGVIGPNGCGKSNIFEAIRWVMGETSSKSLRSGSMDEVIFSGTEKVPAKNFAEVNIYLEKLEQDNNSNREQIIISRILERGVGSFYKINNKDVRAKDVLVLFSDTGSGPRSSSIIGQGNIDQIINFKPIERKIILEEAAGTSGLQSRRHESELKLSATEVNLDRLSDTILSLENQEKSLNRQARQADRYQEITDKIKNNESKLLFQEWNQFESEHDTLIKKSEDLKKSLALSNDKLKTFERKKKSIESSYNISSEKLLKLEREAQLKSSEKNILINKKDLLSNKKQDILYALEIIEKDSSNEKNKIVEFERKIKNIKNEVNNFNIEKLKTLFKNRQTEEFKLQEKLKVFESSLANEMQLVLGEEFKQDTIKESKDFLEKKKNQLSLQADELSAKILQLKQNLKNDKTNEYKKKIAVQRTNIQERQNESNKLNNQKEKEIEKLKKHQLKIENTKNKITEIKTEINTLTNLIKKFDINENSIFNLLKIKKGYENAVYSVLENELSADINQYKKRWTKKEIASLVEDDKDSLKNYVLAPVELEAILSQFILLKNDNLDFDDKKIKVGQVFVTKKGSFKRWDGYIKNKNNEEKNWYDYKDTIKSLNFDLEKYNKVLIELNIDKEKCEEIINSNEENTNNLILSIQNLKNDMDETTNAQRTYQEERASQLNSFDKLNENYKFLNEEILSINTELKKISQNKEKSISNGNGNKKNNSLSIKLSIKEIQSKLSAKRRILSELNEKILGMEINLKYLKNDLKQTESFKVQAEEQLLNLKERFKKYSYEKEDLSNSPIELDNKILDLNEKLKDIDIKFKVKDLEVVNLKKELNQINENIKEIDFSRAEKKTDLIRNEENQVHLNEKKNDLRDIIFQRLKCNPEEITHKFGIQNNNGELIEDLKESLNRLNLQREQMGPVNLRANIEKKEITKKIEEYELEKNDLYQAIQKLRQGISQINSEGKKKLLSAFEDVNKNFAYLFEKLFEGGNARLELLASDDPLQTGVEIFARPPGKKLTSINLLSGGEKTLTAIALIFSIFLINPSPICILDEVDAALDDSNVEKFCQLMNEIKNNTRTKFLIISHHKTTMSMVDRVYGVTMSQKGISDIVSVDFSNSTSLNSI